MSAFLTVAQALAWWIVACAIATVWYCRLAVVANRIDREAARRQHPSSPERQARTPRPDVNEVGMWEPADEAAFWAVVEGREA